MENASNALLIAGAILIGVMVLSVGVYLVNSFGSSARQINQQIADTKVSEFNYQFTKYEGLETIRAHDIVTVCYLAQENNKNRYGYDLLNSSSSPYYITVSVTKNSGNFSNVHGMDSIKTKFETATEAIYQKFLGEYNINLSDPNLKPYYFKCTKVEINSTTKLVRKVEFILP